MKAMKVNELPAGDWLYEMKFDGYRALAFKADKEVRLISRNRNSFNDDYPVLVDSLKSLKTKSCTIRRGDYCAGREREIVFPALTRVWEGQAYPARLLCLRPPLIGRR
jgi:ATP-dependent DNA ligase